MDSIVIDPAIREAVNRGARYLDTRLPGWVDHIDLDRLMMISTEHCVLGQTVGYWSTYNINGDDYPTRDRWVVKHGFCAPDPDSWGDLRQAWIDLITERRS